MNGAVLIPTDNREQLRKISYSNSPDHSVNYWASVLNCDLWTGTELNSDIAQLFNKYDWLLINLNLSMLALVKELRKQTSCYLIGLYEGSVDSICYWDFNEKTLFLEALSSLHCLGSLVERAEAFHSLFSYVPIKWLGVPFPVDYVKSKRISIENRNIITLGSALQHRNTFASLLFALKAFPDYKIYLQNFKMGEDAFLANYLGEIFYERIVLHDPLSWIDYLELYNKSFMHINLCNRYTWGRINLDMAGLGIPVIGTRGCETQSYLFPFTTLKDPFKDILNAQKLVFDLQQDKNFYLQVITYADEHLSHYDQSNAIIRFNDILDFIKKH